MNISEKGINFIKSFEGCKLTAYLCPAGVWTIGYGHTKGVRKGQSITPQEADYLLKQDLKIYEDAVIRNLKAPVNQSMFDSLVSFVYNLGEGSFKSSTLLKKLNAEDYYGASQEFVRWNKAGGKVLAGLTRRREAERNLFNSYPE